MKEMQQGPVYRRLNSGNVIPRILPIFLIIILAVAGCSHAPRDASGTLVLVNSTTNAEAAMTKLIPYLEQYGVDYRVVDIAKEGIPDGYPGSALVIIGHDGIAGGDLAAQLGGYLKNCLAEGIGIVSFDPQVPSGLLTPDAGTAPDTDVAELRFADKPHYITEYKESGGTKELFGYMTLPRMTVKSGRALITGNGHPLLVVGESGKGRIAQWTSRDWMYYSILGPLGGLDDCLWKSMVWAARKPFVMQALPPVATMRVDDVMGSGRQRWDVSPFQWVKTANKYGFKPWMGLFIYNITPEGIEELDGILPAGLATGTPHAFGRPPRPESEIDVIVSRYNPYYAHQMADTHFVPDYWYSKAIPYLSEYYDEFIFFDHNNQKPWPDDVSATILKAVDDWIADTGVQIGQYLVPHWEEISGNMIHHISDKWGYDIMSIRETDVSWGQQALEYNTGSDREPVRTAPFRLVEDPVVGKEKPGAMVSRASYIAGFRELEGRRFFDFSSAVTDITGYEWQPDNDVQATSDRGVQALSRGLEGKYIAILFTHETDYIYDIEPGNWDKIMRNVSEGISKYEPSYLTMEEAAKMQRAFYTSRIRDTKYDPATGQLHLVMTGDTDVPTSVYVYTDSGDTVVEELVPIPPFRNEHLEAVRLTK